MWQTVLFLLFFCIGCSKPYVERFSGIAMTVPWQISILGPLSLDQKNKIQATIGKIFSQIDTIYNKWNPNSELSRFNQSKASEISTVSEELVVFLKKCKEVTIATKGIFDPTIESVQKIWRDCFSQNTIPPDAVITKASNAVGWDNVYFISEKELSKRSDMTAIDLCGIVKGYCVDLLMQALQDIGHNDILVDWGGELKAIGRHPEKRNWNIGIRGIEDSTNPIQCIYLDKKSLATSGNYLQKWELLDGTVKRVYTHVIDTKTFRPKEVVKNALTSVTVIGQECLYADAIATTLLLLDTKEEAQNCFDNIKDVFLLDQCFLYTEEDLAQSCSNKE